MANLDTVAQQGWLFQLSKDSIFPILISNSTRQVLRIGFLHTRQVKMICESGFGLVHIYATGFLTFSDLLMNVLLHMWDFNGQILEPVSCAQWSDEEGKRLGEARGGMGDPDKHTHTHRHLNLIHLILCLILASKQNQQTGLSKMSLTGKKKNLCYQKHIYYYYLFSDWDN